jgi:hypothetical protein
MREFQQLVKDSGVDLKALNMQVLGDNNISEAAGILTSLETVLNELKALP